MRILITGATSGIGFSLSKKLIENGHFVYLCVHNQNQMKPLMMRLKDQKIYNDETIKILKLDITNKKDIEKIRGLDVDCLVNQAGIGIGGSLLNMDISDIEKNFKTNFFGTLNLTKAYIQTRRNKKGKVLITSSLAGIMPIPFLGAYCATKSALTTMAFCLKRELKMTNFDVKIKLIQPGAYKTGFNSYMIENKDELNFDMFNADGEEIINSQEKLFDLIETKSLNTIINKMYRAIISDSNKLIYRAPFMQVLSTKIYQLICK